jgi:D-alanine-D-alanine ligase
MRIAFTHNLQVSGGEHEAEYDTPQTVAAITAALRELGHQVTPLEVSGSVSALVARLEALKPDLVLNTAEGTTGRFREAFFPALFERLGLPFTGSDAYTCALTLDKQLTKLVLSAHGVPMAEGRLVHSVRELDVLTLRYPLICKPNYEGSSMGIGPDSVVENPSDLRARVTSLLGRYAAGVLVEEFIVGRDVVVPFVEGASPTTGGVLEPAAYVIDPAYASKRKFAIYDLALKTSESDAVEVEVPAQIPSATRDEVMRLSRIVFEVLQVRDAARIDYRMRDDGSVVFLEINALPSLEPGAALYKSASLAGLPSVKSVLGAILGSASRRFRIREGAPGGFALAHTLPSLSRAQLGLRKRRVGLIFNLRAPHAEAGQVDEATAEYDSPETIKALREAIESLGCEVVELEATPDLPLRLPLAGIDAAFNLAEGAEGRARESQVPALLEMLGIPYSGSDPTAIAVALDKALAKQVVAHAGIRTPAFVVMTRGDEPLPAGFSFPAIAKPIFEGSSRGVTDKSVVHDEAGLRALVVEQVARYRQPMIVEAFLPGREFTLGVLGPESSSSSPYIGGPGTARAGEQPRVLLPMEVRFTNAANPHPVYGFDNKFYSRDVSLEVPAKVEPALSAELARIAAASFVALGCRDVARVDLRLDAEGRPCFIECNPLPGLAPGFSDLCVIAEKSGLPYEALIGEILKRALEAGTRPSTRP